MRPIYKELTFNRTFTGQFKTLGVDTECNNVIFLSRLWQMFPFYGRVQKVWCCRNAITSLNLRQQTVIIQAFPTACREPRGIALIGSESGRVSLTQEDNTVDEGELKPKMRKESFPELALCLFWINLHTASVFHIVLSSRISRRRSHSVKPAFGKYLLLHSFVNLHP